MCLDTLKMDLFFDYKKLHEFRFIRVSYVESTEYFTLNQKKERNALNACYKNVTITVENVLIIIENVAIILTSVAIC